MRRNGNLELGLFPPYDSGHRHLHNQYLKIEEASESPTPMQPCHCQNRQQQEQQLTIFYDGKICVSDVTELQARSIIMLANEKVEERVRTPTGLEPSSPALQSHNHLYSPSTGLSMKRSLQRFLQKRKNRIQEASPYNR